MTTSTVPRRWHSPEEHLSRLADAVNQLLKGKANNVGTVTLEDSEETTVINDPRIGTDSFIGFMPTTANAAAELGNGTLYVSFRGNETATITHADNVQTDRTFIYIISG